MPSPYILWLTLRAGGNLWVGAWPMGVLPSSTPYNVQPGLLAWPGAIQWRQVPGVNYAQHSRIQVDAAGRTWINFTGNSTITDYKLRRLQLTGSPAAPVIGAVQVQSSILYWASRRPPPKCSCRHSTTSPPRTAAEAER